MISSFTAHKENTDLRQCRMIPVRSVFEGDQLGCTICFIPTQKIGSPMVKSQKPSKSLWGLCRNRRTACHQRVQECWKSTIASKSGQVSRNSLFCHQFTKPSSVRSIIELDPNGQRETHTSQIQPKWRPSAPNFGTAGRLKISATINKKVTPQASAFTIRWAQHEPSY